ncbi:putative aldouronate transport system permease protein [Paenibacillus castaneae]|uniref:carbohydrate ABC transporter permease n=1 Tax=Paenibacillus castaneae TaxID=474957 RepID=UPI000C9C512F|nr:carbohydrate ABC transporter permease [Paenibacillus castaneae]NIK75904.1 putative aldouronate transport system permease protein [Paenibacillus castaneae]
MTRNRNIGDMAFTVLNTTFLVLLGAVTLYPFLNLLAISFNDPLDSIKGQITLWPNIFTINNYKIVFQNDALYSAVVMSVLRTVVGTSLSVICTSMLAYTLSRKEFLLRKPVNLILVISMYVNGGLIPGYLLIKSLGLTNSFWVYIIPGLVGVFNVIIVRSYFDSLPEGLMESARIDGANDFQILFRIVLPVSMPVIATITLFIAVGHWNSWFDNYLFNTRENLNVLQYELMKILTQSTAQVTADASGYVDPDALRVTTPQSIRATMTIIATVPILLVYPFLQKYFIKGMTVGSMKE